MATLSPVRALSSESSFGGAADTFDHVASLSSTPPTTAADSISLASEGSKQDNVVVSDSIDDPMHDRVDTPVATGPQADHASMVVDDEDNIVEVIQAAAAEPLDSTPPSPPSAHETSGSGRSRRARASLPIYNLSKLSGTSGHGKRRSKGDVVDKRRRQTASDAATGTQTELSVDEEQTIVLRADIKNMRGAKKRGVSPSTQRVATRSSGLVIDTLALKLSSLGKRKRKSAELDTSDIPRELRRLRDTNEFAGIDIKPVHYTTWANGKQVTAAASEPSKKKAKLNEPPQNASAKPDEHNEGPAVRKQRRLKRFLDRGLYSGQDAPLDVYKGLIPSEKKALAELPELVPSAKPNKTMPSPMFNGLRFLIRGKDYKLPFDVCNPMPPGQPKPDEWRKMTKNRFVGNASAYWKKTPHFMDQSKCVCSEDDGCGEGCVNRIMLYECDATNCNVGEAFCQNRAFARLQERTKAGNKYRIGVEVIKTDDRGYGIRSNRCFEAGQIIMEYTGEIITEEECDRRMNEKYKDNQCYYLMSFDQAMIIDATTGSIARFVNHSCTPNCRMVKWIVAGQPRMALFAGDAPIMTADELTYDYNFDPFSAKNVQKCLCGSANCRGVLGPKPKEVKPPKVPKAKDSKAAKRKLKDLLEDRDTMASPSKKRKIRIALGAKGKSGTAKSPGRTATGTSVKTVKAVKAIKAVKAVKTVKTVKAVKAAKTVKTAKGLAKPGVMSKGAKRNVSDAKIKTVKSVKSIKSMKGIAKVVKKSVSTISVGTSKAPGLKAAKGKTSASKNKYSVVKAYSMSKVGKTPSKLLKKAASSKSPEAKGTASASSKEISPSSAMKSASSVQQAKLHPSPSSSKSIQLSISLDEDDAYENPV